MEEVETLLFDFVELYNEAKVNIESSIVKDKAEKLKTDYQIISHKGTNLLSILDREFAEDVQLYVLVLSTLFLISKDIILLDKVEELLFLDALPIDVSLRILEQSRTNRFSGGFSAPDYAQARKLHLHMLERTEEEIGFSWKYIPYEERNHNLIILETDTLLSYEHAPTSMVLDIYSLLKYELGYDVFLNVNYLKTNAEDLQDYWPLYLYTTEYYPQLNGDFVAECGEYRDHRREVHGYQNEIRGRNLSFIENSIKIIYEKKPEFVWHIGGESVLSDLFAKVTTLVSMPCTDGFAVSEAPVMVNYLQIDKEMHRYMREYILSHSQKAVQLNLIVSEHISTDDSCEEKICCEEFGIPVDSFVIAIVGNRLDTELTDEFIDIMEQIADRESHVRFLIIGECQRHRWDTAKLKNRTVYLGYRKDLIEVLRATDLFLNPPRQGAGGGAMYSVVHAHVPVVTLPDCDGAGVGDMFVCNSLEEYPKLVSKYCHDREFYHMQVEACKKRQEELKKIDGCAELEKVVSQIIEYAQKK